MASSVANDVIMRIADLVAGCERRRHEPREWHHNENDVTMIIAWLMAIGELAYDMMKVRHCHAMYNARSITGQ